MLRRFLNKFFVTYVDMGFKFLYNAPISISYKYLLNTIDTFCVQETEVTGKIIEMMKLLKKTRVIIIL